MALLRKKRGYKRTPAGHLRAIGYEWSVVCHTPDIVILLLYKKDKEGKTYCFLGQTRNRQQLIPVPPG